MNYFSSQTLSEATGRHIASEPHLRIQVLSIPADASSEFFDHYHGELLLLILEGKAKIRTPESEIELSQGDQVLLVDGEKFNILPASGYNEVKVQYIWAPGPNPCKFCWELDNKFFGNNAT